jgi:hypothetical protein
MALEPKLRELDDYLSKWGIRREHLLTDDNRPLILKIGGIEYVLREEAALFEARVLAQAHYTRAGLPEHRMPPWPDIRPELLLEDEVAA